VLEELFRDEASGREDSESESSSELSNDLEQMSDATDEAALSSENQMTHVRHVVFGDQLIFGRPFVKRFALCYRIIVCLSVLSVCL